MKNWYCIYTKAGYEDHLSQRLMDIPDIESFNPKLKKKTHLSGKCQEVSEKLFPCYVFLRFDLTKYFHLIKYTRGVKRIVGDGVGNPYVVDDGIVQQIQSRILDGFIRTEKFEFKTGDEVVIKEGPLTGFNGIYQKQLKSRDRVLILLSAIMYQASIEVEREYLVRA